MAEVEAPTEVTMDQGGEYVGDAPPGCRLMIRKMVLTNFKSYANSITVGPFDRNMTSVVGPNGNGKSNVIDAMLFVFGFKAKNMRQGDLSDLIHVSPQYPKGVLDFCKVEVHFAYIRDDEAVPGGYTVIEGTECCFSREARKDKTSTYRVDGSPKSLKEMGALLRRKGIDLDHNRFLILQGEVESISQMKPKGKDKDDTGLLEYLEDIIGSNRLAPLIDESFAKKNELDDQRLVKLNLLRASEANVKKLEEPKAAAEAFMAAEAQKSGKESALYQKRASQCDANVAEVTAKAGSLKVRLEDERTKLKGIKEEQDGKEKEFKKVKKEQDKLVENLESAEKEMKRFEHEDIKKREEIKHDKRQLQKLESSIAAEQAKLGRAKGEQAALTEDIPRLQNELETLSKQQTEKQAELDADLEHLQGEIAPLTKQLEEEQKLRQPGQEALSKAENAARLVTSEKSLLEKKAEQGQKELEAAREELAGHASATASARQEHAAATERCGVLTKEIASAQELLAGATAREKDEVDKERKLRAKHDESRASSSSSSTKARQLRALQAIEGFVGRLGSLGTIGKEYDVAASTCCGALDNYVVADTPTAQKCIKVLREKQLGVATFLLLDKQVKSWGGKMDAPFSCPAHAQRLFDLIKCDDQAHRAAFYSAFRDTLVTSDSVKANAIAFDGAVRHRVVTTDGKVINTSGTMEGGGKPLSGRMGPSAAEASSGGGLSEKELQECLAQAEAAAKMVEALRNAMRTGNDELRKKQAELKQTTTRLQKLQLQIDAADDKKAGLEAKIARGEASGAGALSAEEAKRLGELEKACDKAEKEVQKAKAALADSDAKLAGLQEQVQQVGGVRVQKKKFDVQMLGERLASKEKELREKEVKSEGGSKAVAKVEKVVAKEEEKKAELELKIEQAKAAMKQLEDDALEVSKKYEEATLAKEAKEKVYDEIKLAYEAQKAEFNKVRRVELDMEEELKRYEESIKSDTRKSEHWKAKLQELRAKLESEAGEVGASASSVSGAAEEGSSSGEGGEGAVTGAALAADLSAEELEALDERELEAEIAQLGELLEGMEVNLDVIAEYREKEREYRAKRADFDATTEARDAKKAEYDELRAKRLHEFMNGFRIVGMKLKEMYQMITLGGDAELELVDSNDPFMEGICFSVRPPKKSWKKIANLSGGEKTLSSLALVFALHHFKPTPLYVMDEIDAALDYRNISILANYIKERARNAQFVIVSHRNNMFELADRLVGIYKTNDCSKSVAIDPSAFTISVGAH